MILWSGVLGFWVCFFLVEKFLEEDECTGNCKLNQVQSWLMPPLQAAKESTVVLLDLIHEIYTPHFLDILHHTGKSDNRLSTRFCPGCCCWSMGGGQHMDIMLVVLPHSQNRPFFFQSHWPFLSCFLSWMNSGFCAVCSNGFAYICVIHM